jgi:AcrR family transcriptional regulator
MATKSETAYHHGDLRRALIQEALVMIAESGASDLSLRELARRVGVTQTAPYRHFADREALLATVAEEGFRNLTEQSKLAAAAAPTNLDALSAMGRAYLRFAKENPSHYRVMFGPEIVGNERLKYPALGHVCAELDNLYLGVIKKGQESGEIIEGSTAELAESTWAMAHGLSSLLIDGHIGENPNRPFGGQNTLSFAMKKWQQVISKKPTGG